MKPKEFSINEIKVGDSASFSRVFTEKDVEDFAKLSGDMNPLHTDENYASKTKFKKKLVHGMLVGSLCSALVGMHIPGKRCLYLSQTLYFKNPVYINDKVTVYGVVKSKSVSTGILEISISIKKGDEIAVEGEAHVQLI